jgi:preprotein translocase subunit Sss1
MTPAVTAAVNRQRGTSMTRQYAKVAGVVIVLIGVVGLLAGERSLGGVLNIDIAEDLIHLVTGGLMAYVGFSTRDADLLRKVVGGLGVVYLIVGLLGFVVPTLFGLLPSGYSVVDNLIHLLLGVAGIYLGYFAAQQHATTR